VPCQRLIAKLCFASWPHFRSTFTTEAQRSTEENNEEKDENGYRQIALSDQDRPPFTQSNFLLAFLCVLRDSVVKGLSGALFEGILDLVEFDLVDGGTGLGRQGLQVDPLTFLHLALSHG
jgi:hypothetical protein